MTECNSDRTIFTSKIDALNKILWSVEESFTGHRSYQWLFLLHAAQNLPLNLNSQPSLLLQEKGQQRHFYLEADERKSGRLFAVCIQYYTRTQQQVRCTVVKQPGQMVTSGYHFYYNFLSKGRQRNSLSIIVDSFLFSDRNYFVVKWNFMPYW